MWCQKSYRKKARGTDIEWKSQDASIIAKSVPAAKYRKPKVFLDPMFDLTVGAAVMTKRDLMLGLDRGIYPFAPLELFKGARGTGPIPIGTLLVYAGMIRTTERKKLKGKVFNVKVMKHTFITPVGRCIVHDINVLQSL